MMIGWMWGKIWKRCRVVYIRRTTLSFCRGVSPYLQFDYNLHLVLKFLFLELFCGSGGVGVLCGLGIHGSLLCDSLDRERLQVVGPRSWCRRRLDD